MTIVNNELSSDQAKLRIDNPYIYVADPDSGQPLAGAELYFGSPGKDPTQSVNQKRVYVVQEDGSAVPINQPVLTSLGGVPQHNGTPAVLAIDGAYSYKVLDSGGGQRYFQSVVENLTLLEIGVTSVVEDIEELAALQVTVTFPNVDVSDSVIDISTTELVDPTLEDSRSLFLDIDYVVTDGGNGVITLINSFEEGTLIRARQNVTTAQSSSLSNEPRMFTKSTVAEALPIEYSIGDVVTIVGDSTTTDGLTNKYEVVAESTGVDDGVNFVNLDNLLQLRLLSTREKFKTFTESVATAVILSGVLTVDLNLGTTQEVTLTENVSSIIFGNVNTEGASSVTLKIKQDLTGSWSVSFTGFLSPSGTSPVVTVTPEAEDIFIFSTINGTDWYLFNAGQDFMAIA